MKGKRDVDNENTGLQSDCGGKFVLPVQFHMPRSQKIVIN